MGTRSLVRFRDSGKPIVAIYQQFDGYLSGVGLRLADFLNSKKIINGISTQTMETSANGVGCLAAQFISEFKTKIGGLYIEAVDVDIHGIDYIYDVNVDINDNISISIKSLGDTLKENITPDELLRFCKTSN